MAKRLQKIVITAALALAVSVPVVQAEGLPTQKEFRKSLYKAGRRSTQVRLLRTDLIPEVYQGALQAAVAIQRYYEAMAASPTEGMNSGSATLASNHHSIAAAHATALAGCNDKRAKDAEECVVIADFIPKKYKTDVSITLSEKATAEFLKPYRKAKKNKAFAISAMTGHWGVASGLETLEAARAAAISTCEATAKEGGVTCVVISEN